MMDMNQLWEYLDAEVAATPMPKEYANYFVDILCKDCHKVSVLLRACSCCEARLYSAFLAGVNGKVPRRWAEVYPLRCVQHLPDQDEKYERVQQHAATRRQQLGRGQQCGGWYGPVEPSCRNDDPLDTDGAAVDGGIGR